MRYAQLRNHPRQSDYARTHLPDLNRQIHLHRVNARMRLKTANHGT